MENRNRKTLECVKSNQALASVIKQESYCSPEADSTQKKLHWSEIISTFQVS